MEYWELLSQIGRPTPVSGEFLGRGGDGRDTAQALHGRCIARYYLFARVGRGNSRHGEQLLVNQLERIDALLKLDVLIGELGSVFGLAQLLLDELLGALREGREVRTIRESDRSVSDSQGSWSRI